MGDLIATRGRPEPGPWRPTWLREACPAWCARDHRERDHPEDRYHQSEASVLQVIADVSPSVRSLGTPRWTEVELVVRLGQQVGTSTAWFMIEAAEQAQPRLLLTPGSARLLDDEIRVQLESLDLD